MEGIDFKNGPGAAFASILVILSLQLVFRVVEFLWKLKEKKDSASETAVIGLTEEIRTLNGNIEHLDGRIQKLEDVLSEIPKLKQDMRRYYSAIKVMAGDKWPQIRQEIIEDEKTL